MCAECVVVEGRGAVEAMAGLAVQHQRRICGWCGQEVVRKVCGRCRLEAVEVMTELAV